MPKQPRPKARLDYLGAFLSALGLALVVLGVLQASKYGWTAARVPVVGLGQDADPRGRHLAGRSRSSSPASSCCSLFGLWERHMLRAGKDALLNIGMLKNRAVLFGLLAIVAFMFMQAGFLFVGPVFMQMALGYTAFHSGLLILPMTIMIIIVATRVSKLTQVVAPKLIVQVGMLVFVAGILLVAMELKATAQQWAFLPGMIVSGIGIGLINAPLMNITQGAVPAKEQSEISGLSRAMSNLGGAFGTAVAGAVLMSTLIATFSGAVQQFNGIPASEKPRVVVFLRSDAQTVSNAQVAAYLKSKHEPAAAGAEVRAVQPGGARQGPAGRALRHRRARALRLRDELLPAGRQDQEADGGGGERAARSRGLTAAPARAGGARPRQQPQGQATSSAAAPPISSPGTHAMPGSGPKQPGDSTCRPGSLAVVVTAGAPGSARRATAEQRDARALDDAADQPGERGSRPPARQVAQADLAHRRAAVAEQGVQRDDGRALLATGCASSATPA